MNVRVYVGPYIEAWNFDRKLIEQFEESVSDGRGEMRKQGEHWFLIPNQKLPGVDREMSFDKYSDADPICIPAISNEMVQFERLSQGFRDSIHDDGGECTPVQWGVVCGVF